MLFELPEDRSSLDDIIKKSKNEQEKMELLSLFIEKKVSHALFLIDTAVDAWEDAGRKPPSLKVKIKALQSFKKTFTQWQQRSVLARSKGKTIDQKKNLQQYVRLCQLYEKKVELIGG